MCTILNEFNQRFFLKGHDELLTPNPILKVLKFKFLIKATTTTKTAATTTMHEEQPILPKCPRYLHATAGSRS